MVRDSMADHPLANLQGKICVFSEHLDIRLDTIHKNLAQVHQSRFNLVGLMSGTHLLLAFRRFSCGSCGGGEERCEGAGNFA